MVSEQVVLLDMPTMLRHIIRDALSRADFVIAAELDDATRLDAVVRRSGARLVVTGSGLPDLADLARALVMYDASLKVMALEPDGTTGSLFELLGSRTPLVGPAAEELSPERLVSTAREALRRDVRSPAFEWAA